MDRNAEFVDRVFNFCKKKRSVRRNYLSADDSLDNLHKKPTTIRLFGVNLTVNQNDNTAYSCTTTSRESAVTTTGQKMREKNPSRKRKWRSPTQQQQQEQVPAPQFHPRILQEMQHHPILLFKKNLQNSDVSRGQNRLLITKSHVNQLMKALTQDERKKVEINQDNKADFLTVLTTTVADGVEYTLHLKKWPGSGAMVLKHEWSKLARENGLEKGDSVQGWGYRVRDHFRLALYIIKK